MIKGRPIPTTLRPRHDKITANRESYGSPQRCRSASLQLSAQRVRKKTAFSWDCMKDLAVWWQHNHSHKNQIHQRVSKYNFSKYLWLQLEPALFHWIYLPNTYDVSKANNWGNTVIKRWSQQHFKGALHLQFSMYCSCCCSKTQVNWIKSHWNSIW